MRRDPDNATRNRARAATVRGSAGRDGLRLGRVDGALGSEPTLLLFAGDDESGDPMRRSGRPLPRPRVHRVAGAAADRADDVGAMEPLDRELVGRSTTGGLVPGELSSW